MRPRRALSWRALEYEHTEKGSDWFWAVGIVAVAVAATSVILGNILFAVLTLVAVFGLVIFAARRPKEVLVEIGDKGIRIDSLLYPYENIEAFWVEDDETPRLFLRSRTFLVPLIVVSLKDVNPETVHKALVDLLPEEEMKEPALLKLMEHLGF